MEIIAFIVLTVLALLSAGVVVWHRNPIFGQLHYVWLTFRGLCATLAALQWTREKGDAIPFGPAVLAFLLALASPILADARSHGARGVLSPGQRSASGRGPVRQTAPGSGRQATAVDVGSLLEQPGAGRDRG